MRTLPTLLGALVLLGGFIAYVRSEPTPLPPPERVMLEVAPTETFSAVLIQQTGSELRTRDVQLQAAESPGVRLGATLREVVEPFRPEGGAYGHGRTHGHHHGGATDHPHDHDDHRS